jgi:hypothetical protein
MEGLETMESLKEESAVESNRKVGEINMSTDFTRYDDVVIVTKVLGPN